MEDDPLGADAIYVGYGRIMRSLQVLELNLWMIQSLRLKPGASEEQVFAKVEQWDATTFGALYRGMKSQEHWPEDLIWKVGQAVRLRNHLAHNFLREFFLAAETEANYREGVDQLAKWLAKVSDLEAELEEHATSLGGLGWDDLDEAATTALASLFHGPPACVGRELVGVICRSSAFSGVGGWPRGAAVRVSGWCWWWVVRGGCPASGS